MNKKCYIAGPISNRPEEEYRAHFESAKSEVEALGFEPVSPVDLPHVHSKTWEDYMREDITAMLSCEAVYALKGWSQSKGASIEVNLAITLGMDVFQQR